MIVPNHLVDVLHISVILFGEIQESPLSRFNPLVYCYRSIILAGSRSNER